MNAAAFVSFLRPTTAMLALLLLIGWSEQAVGNPLHGALSPPLIDEETYQAVDRVAKRAQLAQNDPSSRLLPRVNGTNQGHLEICCLHANILDFYLNNVLSHQHVEHHQDLHRLKIDLSRISGDLQTKGCHVNQYHNHQHAVEFSKRFFATDSRHRLNKALGEIDILFAYLQDFCQQPKNADAMTSLPDDLTP